MKCPTCAGEIPRGETSCPACSTPWIQISKDSGPGGVTGPPPEEGGPFRAGRLLAGRYRIVRLLGHGGMGEVYQAEDLTLDQTVALKFLPRARKSGRLRLEMLLNEVRLARQVAHPHVCRVYDVVEAEGLHFLSMEYIDGENLAEMLRRIGRLPQERALILAIEICRGLDAAHQRGILHRDLKPANLMLDRAGRIRVTDFGLAWLYGDEGTGRDSPLSGVRAGTPAYMSPEQHLGRAATVKSDLYALGLVLYELVTAQRARRGTLEKESPIEPPSHWVEDLAPEIERIVLRCLETDPERRPATAGEVAAALEQYAAPPWRPLPGLVVPQRPSWRLERRLGAGGFGEAWVAVHNSTGDPRVFKFCYNAAHLQALKREITLFRLLKEELGDRRDITRILDWNFAAPPWFIESEFTESGDLEAWAGEQGGLAAIPLEERLEIVAQVATALAAAHSVGVLHKDVKPSNILMRRDAHGRPRAQLADFGIGMVLERERLDRAGITMLGFTEQTATPSSYGGTRLYMAPELLEGKVATLQADLFALGVVLYQMVVGDFSRALAPGWRRDVGDELLSDDVGALVDGRPERRLSDAARLAQRLRTLPERRAARDEEERVRRAAEAARAALERSRRRRRIGVVVAAAVLLVAASTLYQAKQIARQAARATNIAFVASAGEWLQKDPTRAALLLLEVEVEAEIPSIDSRMREALRQELAILELRGHEDVIRSATWNGPGTHIVTVSFDGTARIWNAGDGTVDRVLRGHTEALMQAAWSPDATRMATASRDDTARIWDLADTDDVLELRGHEDNLQWIAWSHGGRHVATASRDTTARVWDARGRAAPRVLRGHTKLVWMVAWSPDDRHLVTASSDHTARIWSLENPADTDQDGAGPGEPEPSSLLLAGHQGIVWMAAWSPDGRRVATASNDGTVRVWKAAAPADEPIVLAGHGDGVRMAAWSPDGAFLATASDDGTVRLWNAAENGAALEVLTGHEGGVWSVVWSPDGRRLLSTSEDGAARIWNAAPLYALRTHSRPRFDDPVVLRGHGGHVEMGSWSPDGTRVVTISADMTARVWQPGSAKAEIVLVAHEDAVTATAWSADGKRLLTASKDGTTRLWRPDGSEIRVLADHRGAILTAAWSPDGRHALTASKDGTARIRATDGESRATVLEGHLGSVHLAAWSADSQRVLTASADGTARLWTVAGRATHVFDAKAGPVKLALRSPDETQVLTAAGQTAFLWVVEPEEGVGAGTRPARILVGHRDRISAAAWSADGRHVATVSKDGTARIWDLASEVFEPRVFDASDAHPMDSVAWSPGGDLLLTGMADGRVLAWDIASLSAHPAGGSTRDLAPVSLQGHTLQVSRIVFSPSGDRFATTAAENRVLIWSFETVRRVSRARGAGVRSVRPQTALEGHLDHVSAVAWSPDGRYLATASLDGTARIWRLDTENLRTVLRAATRVCLDPEFREDVLAEPPDEAHRHYGDCERAQGRGP